jgi:transcription elongation factor GreA
MDTIHVSAEGLQKLKDELKDCKERRMVVADAIEKARELGDLKENADYHAAKEEQGMLHARMRDIEDKIARSVVLDDSKIDTSKAYQGATVKVLNRKTQKEMTYILVGPLEADMANGKISVRSPVGQALLGKAVGEVAVATVPAGAIKLEIVEISR